MQSRTTDVIMKDLWLHLTEDAVAATDGRLKVNHMRKFDLARGDMASFRQRHYNLDLFNSDPYILKWKIQLDQLFKRYRFLNDVFSQEELELNASAKFAADQLRISSPLRLDGATLMVIREARKLIRETLGTFKEEEHEDLCKFSTRANVGVPYHQAFADVKVRKLTGSTEHINWFKALLKKDAVLRRAIYDRGRPKRPVCVSLRLSKVPKSWKAARTMMPHTVLGSFYTNGMGLLLQQKLKDAGLDISRLQNRHMMLAEKFSVSRTHVTADLSAASDSFTRELLRRLLPSRWYAAILLGSPRYYEDDKKQCSLQSVMTMGMGHTFPLQTLLFYFLLRAVQNLLGVGGIISVYGDDLIYPRAMHKYVVGTFQRLNFNINTDKTFAVSHFRESCGGDYYRGFDVRPFSPEGEHKVLSRNSKLEWLYSLYNGLRLRWTKWEIPRTLYFLLKEIVNVNGVIHQVPPMFPATSGIQVSEPQTSGIVPWSPVRKSRWCRESYIFRYLRQVAKDREVDSEGIHYWSSLQENSTLQQDLVSLYTDSRPRLRTRIEKIWKGRKVFYVVKIVENDKCAFRTLQQTGQTFWPKTR